MTTESHKTLLMAVPIKPITDNKVPVPDSNPKPISPLLTEEFNTIKDIIIKHFPNRLDCKSIQIENVQGRPAFISVKLQDGEVNIHHRYLRIWPITVNRSGTVDVGDMSCEYCHYHELISAIKDTLSADHWHVIHIVRGNLLHQLNKVQYQRLMTYAETNPEIKLAVDRAVEIVCCEMYSAKGK